MLKRCSSFAGSSSKGRNIVICCDGTGVDEERRINQTKSPSNVKKIFSCISTSNSTSPLDHGDNCGGPTTSLNEADVQPGEGESSPLLQSSEDSSVDQVGDDKKSPSLENEEQDQASEPARAQVAYYERGVASIGGAVAKAGGGMTGFGMDKKIIMMYTWLGVNWNEYEDEGEEDRLFLFGFSRGAFAVRSLMGMIYHVGLLDLRGLSAVEAQNRSYYAYWRGYAKRQDRSKWAHGGGKLKEPWKFFKGENDRIPVEFLGAWDTVGQLGLPRETFCLWCCGVLCLFTPNKYQFHDVTIHPLVRCARHAIAMDEMRSTFQPVFDRKKAEQMEEKGWPGYPGGERPDLKQVWFPGSHGDVGGGMIDSGLSDGALKWMIDEAAKKGLRFDEKLVAQIRPNYHGNIHTSHDRSIYKTLTHYPRSIPPVISENAEGTTTNVESIHSSAFARSNDPPIADAPYFPHMHMMNAGDRHKVMVRADKVYNPTYVYLWPGVEYKITSVGTWTCDGNYLTGPEGLPDSIFGRPVLMNFAVALGKCQRGLREVSGNKEAHLPFVRRHEYYPWHSVIGMIACGGVRDATARAEFHEIIGIGKEKVFTVGEKGGYLYCYANDSWSSYVKNKGNMELTIERLT